ncbi:unnamed protein product [marine sediment metagenome]|uniref:Uncharacterized protein n=1 Tax=marine sediment metagenome TaxID=412755 RepID=X1CJ74_9ZZZZ
MAQFLLSCITKKEHNHHQRSWISNSNYNTNVKMKKIFKIILIFI